MPPRYGMARGELVLMHIWDTGGELDLKKVEKVEGRSPELVGLKLERTAPAYLTIKPAPLQVELRSRKVKIAGKEVEVKGAARIYAIGAVAITLRIPVHGELEKMIPWMQPLRLDDKPARAYVEEIFNKIMEDIRPAIEASYPAEKVPEEYTILALTEPKENAIEFIDKNRKLIAGLLREEDEWHKLSDAEAESATKHALSYFENDLTIVDWSAALILEPEGKYEDTLLTIELANLQLLELRTFDGLFDTKIASAQSDIEQLGKHVLLARRVGKIAAEIAAMHTEMDKLIADTMNITKFAGDYHLARLYDALEDRLHIIEWYRSVERKLDTLKELYSFASDRLDAQRSTFLEIVVILLIVGEILMAFFGLA